jgi:hypothetical protein
MGRYGFLQRCLQHFYAYCRRQFEQHSELVVAVCFAQTLTGEVNAELGLGERRNHYGVSFLISQLAFLPNPRPPLRREIKFVLPGDVIQFVPDVHIHHHAVDALLGKGSGSVGLTGSFRQAEKRVRAAARRQARDLRRVILIFVVNHKFKNFFPYSEYPAIKTRRFLGLPVVLLPFRSIKEPYIFTGQ